MISRALRDLIISGIFAALMFTAMNSLTVRSFVEGPSMEPSLHSGQALLISRLGISGLTRQVYAATHQEEIPDHDGWVPPRGSIVTFAYPGDPSKVLVKRVIGLPGETISISNGVVYVNGHQLAEPYVTYHDQRGMAMRKVPEDSLFMMGDNRPDSNDSRFFGPVPRSNLLGVAVVRYWPLTHLEWLLGNSQAAAAR